jgi:autotransporter-associated beta strand protein
MKPSFKLRYFLLAAASLPLGTANAYTSGATSWTGVAGGDWANAAGWSTATAPVTGEAPTSRAIRINLNNGSSNTLIYAAAQGHTIYTGDASTSRTFGSSSSSGGSMTITGGTFDSRSSSQPILGYNGTGGTYTLTINGSDANFINTSGGSSELMMGYTGTQSVVLNVNNGNFTNGNLRLGFNTSSSGITSTVNLNGGVAQVTGFVDANSSNSNSFTVNFNGGTLRAGGSSTTFMESSEVDNAVVQANGAVIDTNNFNITIAKALTAGTGGGGLTKEGGAGTLTLSGTNTYTGATSVSTGTLALASTGSIANSSTISVGTGGTLDVSAVSGWTVGSSQTVGGTGTIVGNATIEGTLSPGQSPGTLAFDDNLSIATAAEYFFEGGDLTTVGGTLTLNSDWILALGSGLQDGGSITIFEYATAGSFDLTPTFDITSLGFSPSSSLTLTNTGSEIVLNGVSFVPEPTAALLGSLGLLALLRRRR